MVLERQKIADMDLPGVPASDNREIEIVAKDLPMRRGIPLACDATVVSPLHASGEARPRVAEESVAIAEAEDLKAYPELVKFEVQTRGTSL